MQFASLCLAILGMTSIGQAGPVGAVVSTSALAINDTVQKEPSMPLNPCDGVDAEPYLYHNYTEADCAAKFHVRSDGTCDQWYKYVCCADASLQCASFCQQETFFSRARESPYPRTECHWPGSCSITESHSTSWNWGVSFSPKVGKALKVGISGSYGHSWGDAHGISWSFQPAEHECGYFTFVPTKKTTCGLMTEGILRGMNLFYYCVAPNSYQYCAEEVWLRDGKPDGVVVFVKIDCVTRQPLPMDQQDPVYRQPGVPLDRGSYQTMVNSWPDNTCMHWETSTSLGEATAFEIHGVNFDTGVLGANGEHLIEKIQACGPESCTLAFHQTPDDPKWNWKATGCLQLGAKAGCIGDAILAVGGRTKDGCV